MKAARLILISLAAGFASVAVPTAISAVSSPMTAIASPVKKDRTVLDTASAMCRLIARSQFVHQCDVTEWLSSIDVTIPLEGQNAANACRHTRKFVTDNTNVFQGKDWQVRIISPLKSNGATAICPLV